MGSVTLSFSVGVAVEMQHDRQLAQVDGVAGDDDIVDRPALAHHRCDAAIAQDPPIASGQDVRAQSRPR
jgi:hypothetical protein